MLKIVPKKTAVQSDVQSIDQIRLKERVQANSRQAHKRTNNIGYWLAIETVVGHCQCPLSSVRPDNEMKTTTTTSTTTGQSLVLICFTDDRSGGGGSNGGSCGDKSSSIVSESRRGEQQSLIDTKQKPIQTPLYKLLFNEEKERRKLWPLACLLQR